MSQQLSVWDLDEWRMVVQDLMNAMEAHDIAHFVEAGHPENYHACVAASDALQVAQRRARAMLELTKGLEGSPGGTLDGQKEPSKSTGLLPNIHGIGPDTDGGPNPDYCPEPEWWRKCNEIGHATSINDLNHRNLDMYAGAVEYFCSHCTRGEVYFPGEKGPRGPATW